MANAKKQVIGREIAIDFDDEVCGVPAKIDTGADGSAVWASDIFVDKEGLLHFYLFGKGSKYWTGKEHTTSSYRAVMTKSSLGNTTIKYRVKLPIRIADKRINVSFGLSDRSSHNYPVLIGRRTLSGKFIVDVEKTENLVKIKKSTTLSLNKEMRDDPYKFHKKYYKNGAN